jgi:hypothetical protein
MGEWDSVIMASPGQPETRESGRTPPPALGAVEERASVQQISFNEFVGKVEGSPSSRRAHHVSDRPPVVGSALKAALNRGD